MGSAASPLCSAVCGGGLSLCNPGCAPPACRPWVPYQAIDSVPGQTMGTIPGQETTEGKQRPPIGHPGEGLPPRRDGEEGNIYFIETSPEYMMELVKSILCFVAWSGE